MLPLTNMQGVLLAGPDADYIPFRLSESSRVKAEFLSTPFPSVPS